MSDEKQMNAHSDHDIERNGGINGGINRTMTTVTLTAEQFESLYLQPKMGAGSGLLRRSGNATPLGVSSFLLAHTPLAMDLLGFQAADGNSGLATLGAFYGCAGVGLWVSAIFEWAAGNTFPMVVFGTFGGFWTSYAILIQPTFRVAAAFAPANVTDTTFAGVTATAAGAATHEYNSGAGLYFVTWSVMCFIYSIAATRTNVPFLLVFMSLTVAFGLLAAAHFHTGVGELTKAASEFKAAGGFAFITALSGFWIDVSLILKAVDFPIEIPIMDLSGLRFMQSQRQRETKERTD